MERCRNRWGERKSLYPRLSASSVVHISFFPKAGGILTTDNTENTDAGGVDGEISTEKLGDRKIGKGGAGGSIEIVGEKENLFIRAYPCHPWFISLSFRKQGGY